MLSPFGQTCRKIRNAKGLRLLDTASLLGKSSAFISAIETGKKPIPQGFEREVAQAMNLSPEETEEVQGAADRTRKEIPVSNLEGEQRELVAAFARKVNGFSESDLAKLREQIFKVGLKSIGGDIPFHRRRGLLVKPRSMVSIWDIAEIVRSFFTEPSEIAFPIADVIEFKLDLISPGAFFDVCTKEEMGEDEGRAIPELDVIQIRKDVYEGAWNDMGRHRFTLAHELGHFLMHREVSHARMKPSDDHPIYRDAEWQADTFAGALLMSTSHLHLFKDEGDAAEQCKITGSAADVIWDKYKKKGKFN